MNSAIERLFFFATKLYCSGSCIRCSARISHYYYSCRFQNGSEAAGVSPSPMAASPVERGPEPPGGKRRPHGMLKLYYGLPDPSGETLGPARGELGGPTDINGPHFDPEVFLTKVGFRTPPFSNNPLAQGFLWLQPLSKPPCFLDSLTLCKPYHLSVRIMVLEDECPWACLECSNPPS